MKIPQAPFFKWDLCAVSVNGERLLIKWILTSEDSDFPLEKGGARATLGWGILSSLQP